jgi:hypothetical protein
VDVTTDHAVHPPTPSFIGHGGLEVLDEMQRVLHLDLQIGRETPVAEPQATPQAIHHSVQHEDGSIGPIPEEGEPLGVLHDAVELVAMHDQVALAVGRLVDHVARHDHPAEVHAAEVADAVVVVAGDVDHFGPLSRHPQDLLDHVVVGLGPVPAAAQLPAVDDVADQIELVALDVADEVQQQLGLTPSGPQVQVADEDGTVAANGDVGAHGQPPLRCREIAPSPDRKMAANGWRLS